MFFIRFTTILLFFILVVCANAQKLPDEKNELAKAVEEAYKDGNYPLAIKAADKLIGLCRKSSDRDPDSLINSIVNAARIRREYFIALQYKGHNPLIDARDRRDAREDAYEIVVDTDKNYREAMSLAEKYGKANTVLMAAIKRDLGWVTWKHYPDDMPRANDAKAGIKNDRARIDEAEKFFLEAMTLYQELVAPNDKERLMTSLDLGDFYFFYNNYDKALGYYEDFLEGYAERNNAMLASLRQAAKLYQATFQNAKYETIQKQIDTLAGGLEKPVKADLSLGLRSKDAVAHSAKFSDIALGQARAGIRGSRIRSVRVNVVVDGTGKIIEAVADTTDTKLAKKAVDEVSTWYVRPVIYKGTAYKLRGFLTYVYSE